MSGVNKVILVGRLGQDPESRSTGSGTAVCNLSLATSERWKGKDGQQQERTEWHRVVLWGRLAEIAAEYLRKGSQAYIEGRLETRKWEDKEGNPRYTTEIVARELQLLGSRGDNTPAPKRAGPPEQVEPGWDSSPGNGNGAAPKSDEFNDDIPF